MAKKKSRKGKVTKQRQREVKVTKKDIEQGKEAIKTMVTGMVLLAVFIGFFAIDVGDQTMYERVSSVFSSSDTPNK